MTDAEKKLIEASLKYTHVVREGRPEDGPDGWGRWVDVVQAAKAVRKERRPQWPTEPGLYWATIKCPCQPSDAGRRLVQIEPWTANTRENRARVARPDGTLVGMFAPGSYDYDRDEDGNFVRVTDPKASTGAQP